MRSGRWILAGVAIPAVAVAVYLARRPASPAALAPAPLPGPASAVPQTRAATTNAQLIGADAPVLVQFTLDNSYPANEQSLVDAALQILPAREVPLGPSASVDDLVRREYAISRATPGAVYSRVVEEIRRRGEIVNGLLSPTAAGTVRIPQLSPYTETRNNLSAYLDLRAGRDVGAPDRPSLPDGGTFTADSAIKPSFTTYWVRATARDLADGPLRTLALSSRGQILAKQIDATLAGGATDPTYPPFVLNDADRLRTALSAGRRDLPLFVLDTGWPNEEEWKRSLRALKEMSLEARKWYRFPMSQPPLDAVGAFPQPDGHVVKVHASLREVVPLSPRVHVIYVPITLAQNAEPILREIITIGLAISRWGHPTSQPEASQGQRAYHDIKKEDVDNVIATISKAPENGTFKVNTSLLRGLFYISQRVVSPTDDGYFVNMSWTTDDAAILAQPVEPARGFIVAAVGNEDSLDVVARQRAFAGLVRLHKNILAVMTMNGQGSLDCHSSKVTFRGRDVGAVGYFGQVSSTDCFSSFAAPRVAWFLAARETLRQDGIGDPALWAEAIRDRVSELRTQTDPLPGSLLFNPLKYIQ